MDDIRKLDLVDIELTGGSFSRSWCCRSIGMADSEADRFGVKVFRDGEPVSLSGASVQGFFRNSQGENIALTSAGTVSGNVAYVTLPQACYNYDGKFTLAIKLIGGGVTGTMRIVDGMVDNTNTGGAVAPTSAVPTYQEVLAVYEQMVEALEDAEGILGMVAEEFDELADYRPGDRVSYNGALYCFLRPHEAGAWVADDAWEITAAEAGAYTDATLEAVSKMALKGRKPLPGIFAYGSIAASTAPRPAYKANGDKYRICTVTPVVVDLETTFTVAEGFRARRYWFDRETGEWGSFDGTWQTGSITLTTDKIYYINIARETDVTTEVADISEWIQAVYVEQEPGQAYIALAASAYNNLLANVDENVICNCSIAAGWEDTPDGGAGIFENQQYSGSYNVQRYTRFGNDRRLEYVRIVNRTSHQIYSDWVMTIHEENPRILVVGDSIAKGTRNSNKGFVGDLGMAYINMGVGGATLSDVHSTYNDSIHKWASADNIPNQLTTYYGKSDADVQAAFGKAKFTPDIVVADGGINDYIYNAGLGELSAAPAADDTAAAGLDRDTLTGALEYLFYQMVKLYPRAQRYFVITHKTYRPTGQYYPTRVNSAGYTQEQMHDAIVACCRMYGVVPVDVYAEGIMNTRFQQYRTEAETWSSALATDYCDKDGVHPLAYGYSQVYAPILREAIRNATRK